MPTLQVVPGFIIANDDSRDAPDKAITNNKMEEASGFSWHKIAKEMFRLN